VKAPLSLALSLVAGAAAAQVSPEGIAPLPAAPATAAGTTGLQLHPGLEAFAQYSFRLTNVDTGGLETFHVFDVPRVHVSLQGEYDHARARVVAEAVRSASEGALLGVAGDSILLRVREAWGGWISPHFDVRAGVLPTLTVPEVESTWGLRAVTPTPLEATRLVAPADLGVTARYHLPRGLGHVAVGVYNGEGYAQREFNRGKNLEALAFLRPLATTGLQPLCVFVSYVLGSSGLGDGRADRFTGGLLWRGTRVRGGATFTWAWGADERPLRESWLGEVFLAAEPLGALLLGARFLRWQRDVSVDTDRVTQIVATVGWRVARPWEVFLAGTRTIPGGRAVLALPGSDHWDFRAVSHVVF
jgi:hypothetical protein